MTTPSSTAYEQVAAEDILDKLCASSRRHYSNPYEAMTWPATLDRTQWFTSPELISIYGTPEWTALSESQRKQVSFWEAVNFFSLNIHGEKSLMEGLATRLYDPDKRSVADYLHHMLDEENKHSVYFGGFCNRYANKVYPNRKIAFGEDPPEARDFLFFAKVMIFEEVVDRQNVIMARDSRLAPIARFINDNHHLEETRHLAFGRRMVRALFAQGLLTWTPERLTEVRGYLVSFLRQSWREYYNPAVYADAGLAEPWRLAQSAYEAPTARKHRQAISSRCLQFMLRSGILEEIPAL